ncbi:hypothetical protein MIND_01073400 [Mycena indigotica]|uniref:Rhamnogalacturonase A/B/Epimerase-like pectate lyase domain-containing protein n=1 Tax=Mycena indigotica TaxID=2126181 RepID=A0A8H6S990_9AGAR|nr:uncharacterized protein MIND_01073400 [Mycena indigotica]KAF7295340.1 hypothetical protein MIND_01073400 [Mycena indigotica]
MAIELLQPTATPNLLFASSSVCPAEASTLAEQLQAIHYHFFPRAAMKVASVLLSLLLRMSILASSQAVEPGFASSNDTFWLQAIKHQGKSAYNSDATYEVFRNVKDFGAKGDGVTDDTNAINAAISSGHRCTSNSSTHAPISRVSRTYLVSKAIIAYYYTVLIGDAKNPPTLLAAASFTDIAVIDANPYLAGGQQWYVNQNNFFRSIRNFIIDTRLIPPENSGTGIHWQVAQATSLVNIHFYMSDAPNSAHQGIFMENGSGGFMGDLVFDGGKFGMWVGNQQFTVRNVTINNAQIAIQGVWAWGWTFQGLIIRNCSIGFDLLSGVGAEAIIDAKVYDTPIFVRTPAPSNGKLVGSLVLNNVHLHNVATAVGVVGGAVVLAGGAEVVIDSWVQGNVYKGNNPVGKFNQNLVQPVTKPVAVLSSTGEIFGRMHPQYENYHVSQFVSVRDHGASGDGTTDDTAALQAVLNKFAGTNIIFFDAGTYIVKSTLTIPAGSRIVGEAWSIISGAGPAFQDQENPQVVVRVGAPGSRGVVEITDIVFSTVGPAPGAIVVEWNIHESELGSAGAWDTHIRLGGAAGTNLETEQCKADTGQDVPKSIAAFMALHLTPSSTAYLEGLWVWTADHELDQDGTSLLNIFAGRGILSESQGPVWLVGTAAEHFFLYQYQFFKARNHYVALMQTETPYFQPYSDNFPHPFTLSKQYNDPPIPPNLQQAWAALVRSSSDIFIFGAGLYSFFSNYSKACIDTRDCQTHILDIDKASSSVEVFSLATVSSRFQISMDGVGVVNEKDNNGTGFASTVTRWSN